VYPARRGVAYLRQGGEVGLQTSRIDEQGWHSFHWANSRSNWVR
jgi:hypothetical protein